MIKYFLGGNKGMTLDFSIQTDHVKDVPVLRVNGEVDIHTCPNLTKELLKLIEDGENKIILNLENVHYIDSTGLGTIAYSAKKISGQNG